jgi:hypothetical protein
VLREDRLLVLRQGPHVVDGLLGLLLREPRVEQALERLLFLGGTLQGRVAVLVELGRFVGFQ